MIGNQILEKILIKWKSLYPEAKIVGHRDTGNTSKTCPNFDVKTWAKDMRLKLFASGILSQSHIGA